MAGAILLATIAASFSVAWVIHRRVLTSTRYPCRTVLLACLVIALIVAGVAAVAWTVLSATQLATYGYLVLTGPIAFAVALLPMAGWAALMRFVAREKRLRRG